MDISEGESKYVKISASDAQAFVEGVLEGNGVPKENAAIVANCLVQADLRGVDTHGINRIPSYMARVRQGVLDPKAIPSLVNVTPVVAQVSCCSSKLPNATQRMWEF
jgi:LDH2 family malate/lactate/ureidoglycolate dehydrogenase